MSEKNTTIRTIMIALYALFLFIGAAGSRAMAEPDVDNSAGQSEVNTEELISESVEPRTGESSSAQEPGPNWVDHSQRYVTNSADTLANWLDRFFGSSRAEIEAAYSILRLTADSNWQESLGNTDDDVRLRGKVHLPRIDERLSLVFTDEKDNETGANRELRIPGQTNTATESGLQYKVKEKKKDRLDLKLGLRSTGKLKASARYRYEWPLDEDIVNRFVQTVYFRDGEGFGTEVVVQHDRLIDDSHLFRWSNNATFAEDIEGVDWSSQVNLSQRLGNKSAVAYFTWVRGITRPEYLTQSYGIGVNYRRSFYRRWLFFEFEPAYAWQRGDRSVEREPSLLFTVRMEILFEADRRPKSP